MDPLSAAAVIFKSISGKSKKFLARVLEAATLENALNRIDSLEKTLQERELLIENQYFPYQKQFTPQDLFARVDAKNGPKPPEINPRLAHPMFGRCRIPSNKAWKFDPKITQFDFSGWFDLERFNKIDGLPEIVVKWRALLGNDVACWKGNREVEVLPDSHPYLRRMYPFVWVARIPMERIEAQTDQISYLVVLFIEWANRLAGRNVKTSLSINRLVVLENSQAYIKFRYDFHDIQAVDPKGRWKNYYLFRDVAFAASGHHVYFVSAGEPRENPHKPTEYAGHIEHWFKEFQLGHD